MLDRLNQLEMNIHELRVFHEKTSLSEIKDSIQNQWILRYGLFESIQIVIDVSCHLVSKYNLGSPKTYAECVDLLYKFEYIDKELAGKLSSMVGLRNILIHEYVTIDVERLHDLLGNIDDFADFAKAIKDYL
ncbi:MAG TPA: DUF86 domain-containing protein [Candidatus Wolfebacteria bacterium]|nr:DUF86 domain-containing protein [Candidatus Wolfebacteria bacterium]